MKANAFRVTRHWAWFGVLCWAVLAALFSLSMGLRNVSYGLPFFPAWMNTTAVLLMILTGAALAIPVLVLTYEMVLALHQAREKEREAALLEAEVSRAQAVALRARLNPDFLFDTFKTASELMETDAATARRLLADLGAVLRASLGQTGDGLVSCGDELELLQHYLDIQRTRLGNRLHATIELKPDAVDASLPPLVLQPIVEPMVRHGTARECETLILHVSATRLEEDLCLIVLAAGPGFERNPAPAVPQAGLDNTRTRLVAAYGNQPFVVRSRVVRSGVEVEIRVPQVGQGGWRD